MQNLIFALSNLEVKNRVCMYRCPVMSFGNSCAPALAPTIWVLTIRATLNVTVYHRYDCARSAARRQKQHRGQRQGGSSNSRAAKGTPAHAIGRRSSG